MLQVPDGIELVAEEEMGLYTEYRILSGALERLFEFKKMADLYHALEEAGMSIRGLGAYSTPLAARSWIQSRMAAVHRQLWDTALRRAHELARHFGKQLYMESIDVSLSMDPVGFGFRFRLGEVQKTS